MTADDKIHSDFDDAERFLDGVVFAVGVGFLLIVGAWCATATAQTITAPTRATNYDWACLDASGELLSTHQRFDTAFVACYNNAQGAEIAGGRYRINRQSAPPTACPAQPASSQTLDCPAGTTGTWQQTRTVTSAPSPTCWTAGTWTPSAPSSGSCPAVPAPAVAPVLGAARVLRTTGTNHDIALSWTAVAGEVGYKVERCAGASCTSFSLLTNRDPGVTSAADTNVSPTTNYRYRVRACADRNCAAWLGEYSNVVMPQLSGTPAASPGTALLQWEHDLLDTESKPVALWGYRIHYSPVLPESAGPSLSRFMDVPMASDVRRHVVENLAAGTWAFALQAISAQGHFSTQSDYKTKVVL